MEDAIYKNAEIDKKIESDRVKLIYSRTPTVLLTLLIISAVYLALLVDYYPVEHLLGWYLVLVAVLGWRWRIYRLFRRESEKPKFDSLKWLSRFRFWILITGFVVGSVSVLFDANEFIKCLFPVGILAATVVMLPDFISFQIYTITLLLPIIVQLMMIGDKFYNGISAMLLVMAMFLLKFSWDISEQFVATSRLKYENQALLAEVEREKRKLDDRLGHILNDSSNEIYVVDARSLRCIQVNRGAIQNLGYGQAEIMQAKITDIFSELDASSFNELIRPLYKGRRKSVFYRGANQRKDGSTYPVEARFQLSIQETPIIVVTARDVTERSEWEKKLIYQANFDQLTGLFNRHYMQAYMESVFSRARRHRNRVGLLFVDLDNFKTINDTYGHGIGDVVLKETANRIKSLLRQSDTPARTGGDEFTILLEGLDRVLDAEIVARKLVDKFQEPFQIKGQEVFTTVSIGICVYPDDGETLAQLMQYADMAMYKIKMEGRNGYCFFSPEMCAISEEQMKITNRLRQALDRDEFHLYFQPIIDIDQGKIVGAEALLRWFSPDIGEISPGKFIPMAENMGLIDELGSWVLEKACREAAAWQQYSKDVYVSVNISSQQFRTGKLLELVDEILRKSALSPSRLQLEITESLLLQDSDTPFEIFQQLNQKGIRLALDDFGTGYSSLGYLRRFPLHVLKIDRSFIHDLESNHSSRALVRAIIAMAHSLNMEVIAEGIENPAQLEFLRLRRVGKIQGFFYSPPVPVREFISLLVNDEAIWAEIDGPSGAIVSGG